MWNIWITVFGFCFLFMMTALGASVVFLFKGEISPKIRALFSGFAAGVMLAASVWSLILPSMSQAERYFQAVPFLPAVVGIFGGCVFLVLLDAFVEKIKSDKALETDLHKKTRRLFLAVTLHNIPEGLAVGFAFGAAYAVGVPSAYAAALGLAIGIGVQNFPEGAALSLPMKERFHSNKRAFAWGMSSGVVEPVFATVGFFLAAQLQILQPWLLAFAAGAMIFVSVEDLIPETKCGASRIGAWSFIVGFCAMMILDVALG
ncbi:MAG: ZIP family metal transporter [Clostridia bacterium]|nr:ZIP family metal transporter [Clostridia bacterium]